MEQSTKLIAIVVAIVLIFTISWMSSNKFMELNRKVVFSANEKLKTENVSLKNEIKEIKQANLDIVKQSNLCQQAYDLAQGRVDSLIIELDN